MNRKITFIFLMVAIYLIGIISGTIIGKIFFRGRDFRRRPPSSEHVVGRFARELNLTDAQKKQVMKILENNRDTVDKYHDELNAKTRKTMDAVNDGIRAILTEEQKKIFDKILKDRPKRPEPHGNRPHMRPPENDDRGIFPGRPGNGFQHRDLPR